MPEEFLEPFEHGRSILRGELPPELKAELFERREQRPKPQRDDKAIAAWNGLALAALAEAGRRLERDDWLAAARALGDFLLGPLSTPDGRLYRTHRNGIAKNTGFLEDYADVAHGLYELHVATGEPRWLEESRRLALLAVELFADEERGGFFLTPHDGEALVARKKDFDDHPTPSGNSMLAYVLLRLARIYGDVDLERRAVGVFRLTVNGLRSAPSAFGWTLCALDLHFSPPRELAHLRRARRRDRPRGTCPVAAERGRRVRPGRRRAAARGKATGRRQADRLRLRELRLPRARHRRRAALAVHDSCGCGTILM